MKLKNSITIKLFITAAFVLTAACSTTPSVQNFPTTADPNLEVSRLNDDIASALENQSHLLSPVNFAEAQESLVEAKENLQKKGKEKETLEQVALGRAYLKKSQEFARLSENNLGDVFIARKQALVAGASKYRNQELKEADKNLREATSDIEDNDLDKAMKNRKELQSRYLALELDSIKIARLGPARVSIAKAIKAGAKDFAPRSLALAEKSVLDTEAYITANRHDTKQIAARSDESYRTAEHLMKITLSSKKGEKSSAEDQALRLDAEQQNVARKESQILHGANANVALVAANSNLQSEQTLNRIFEQARKEFTAQEAEVYKQGNTLTIRLRGLQFPSSKASLEGSNFPLLAKVQRVIKEFGKTSVIIEGHTDSIGGESLNEELSTARAEAVRDYLVSNVNESDAEIKAVGYGFQKPLATNKTADGRAQNRRVDVLIQPDDGIDRSSN